MNIRKATVNDFENVKKIRTEFFLLEASTDRRIDPNYVKRGLPIAIGKGLRNKNELYLLAEKDDEIIGFAASEIISNPTWAYVHKKQGHLFNLYVLPEYQGKGIGKKLVEKTLAWFKERKVKDLKILVYAENTGAKKLYEKYGFTEYMKTMKRIDK